MKKIYKSVPLLFIAIAISGFYTSCKKDKTNGIPQVSYVRITDPAKSDSLLIGAYLGNVIAIRGANLGDVKEIWFNDQKASLNPTYITAQTIIVTVPDSIPKVVTNKMKLIYGNMDTMAVDFRVLVPAPIVQSMVCEYVNDGDIATIDGDFFIDDPNIPLQVFFTGNVEGKVLTKSKKEITVKVPVGAGKGRLAVKSLYGVSLSKFYFRDDRNIIVDFDNLTAAGGWRSGVMGSSNPDPISGNYVRFSGAMQGGAGATWDEDHFSFNYWPIANGRPKAQLYTGDLNNAEIKFECNVVSPWQAAALEMIFTPYATTGTNSYIGDANVPRGLWIPWQATGSYTTNGWVTVAIPLTAFKYNANGVVCPNALTADMLYGLTFFVFNGGVAGTACNPNICIDNVRIVPIQ
jgi:hypothetical protein